MRTLSIAPGAALIPNLIWAPSKAGPVAQEEEMRFIGNRQEVNLIMDGYVSEVIFGAHVPAHTLKRVMANIVDHCSVNNIRIPKL
jgi:hypothetical protein